MNPRTDRAEMIICLRLKMRIVGMDETQNEERMNQQVETERRNGNGPERPSVVGCSSQERHW